MENVVSLKETPRGMLPETAAATTVAPQASFDKAPKAPPAPWPCPQVPNILSGMGAARRPLSSLTALAVCLLLGAQLAAAPTLDGLSVYPNPARQYAGNAEVIFDNLTPDVEIRIYDAEGVLVREFETQSSGLSFRWNMKDDSGVSVASGIYIYVVGNEAGENKVGKVAVIR